MVSDQKLSYMRKWGRFLTPDPIAKVAADWAITSKSDSFLDVAVGEGVFLIHAARRLKELGASIQNISNQLYGAEISRPSYNVARQRLLELEGVTTENLYNGDFFNVVAERNASAPRSKTIQLIPAVRAALGNPPFIRYSMISGATRRRALNRVAEAGIKLKGPVDASVLFLIHTSSLVDDSGRLAIVVPERVLFTDYGSLARSHLREKFRSVRLVLCNGWSFSQASERVVLVLAANSGNRVFSIERMDFDSGISPGTASPKQVQELGSREAWRDLWIRTKLDPQGHEQFKQAITNPNLHTLQEFAKISIGCVTGANRYFVINKEVMSHYSLPRLYFRRAVAQAKQINGLFFTNEDWLQLFRSNENCLLLRIDEGHPAKPSRQIKAYLDRGRRLGIRSGYKLSHRAKWYKVPVTKTPDVFFTYMSHQFPRLVINNTMAVNLNSIHSLDLTIGDKIAFCTAFYNSLTMLSCELTGRIYSGGVLKIEPGELKEIPIVEPSELGLAGDLARVTPIVDGRLSRGDLEGVLDVIDPIVLGRGLGFNDAEINALRASYLKMRQVRIE